MLLKRRPNRRYKLEGYNSGEHTGSRRLTLYKLGCLFVVTMLLFSLFSYIRHERALATTDTFNASGTWTVPAGVSSAVLEAWGSGGAGGGATAHGPGGGGGAGGQYAKKTLSGLSVGANYTVAVAGVTSGGTGDGAAGGDSSVVSPSSTTVVLAKGGGGGIANDGAGGTGSTAGGVGDTVFAGGSGMVGGTSSGGGGGGAGSAGAGGNASGTTGGTGTAANGGSGGAGTASKANGSPGSNFGGGGGGGNLTHGGNESGGDGAAGLVTVTYTINSAPAAPTLSAPGSGATGVSLTPGFSMSSTDADGNAIKYRLYLYQSDCSTAVSGSPFDQTSSGIGWDNGTTAYASGATATYTYQGTLVMNTTYCWKADAIDPGGTNSYGSASATRLFTTIAGPTTDQVMRGGQYFTGGSKQSYYWAR
jgi:hypothetical protein